MVSKVGNFISILISSMNLLSNQNIVLKPKLWTKTQFAIKGCIVMPPFVHVAIFLAVHNFNKRIRISITGCCTALGGTSQNERQSKITLQET